MESDKLVAIREPSAEEEIQSKTSSPQSSSTTAVDDDDETAGGLSKLPYELELSEEDKNKRNLRTNAEEEIIKELKNIKRQNSVTHRLLTAMIVLTLTWQLSEVSLILKIKEGFSNPLKSLGGMIRGLLPKRPSEDQRKQVAGIEPPSLPGLKIPELSYLELPGFDTSDDD